MARNQRCKYCGAIVMGSPKYCPECGRKIRGSGCLTPVLVIFFSLFILLYFCVTYLTPNTDSSSSQSPNTPSATSTPASASAYDKEIRFQDYSWGDSASTVAASLGEQAYDSMTPTWEDADSLMPMSSYQLGYRVFTYGNREIAGYKVANFSMYFMYGQANGQISTSPENSELYLVTMNFEVADVESTYDDLYQKLTSIYGEGKTSTRTDSAFSLSDGGYKSDVTVTEWTGANNTGIQLVKEVPRDGSPDSADSFSRYVVLSYGKTDSASTLSNLYKQYRQYVSASESEKRDSQNTDGL